MSRSLQKASTWKTVGLAVVVLSFTLPIFRSGGKTGLTLWGWIVNHTIFGEPVEYIPKEAYQESLEKTNRSVAADALLRMVNHLYNTDDEHLPELTRIPINAARPLALGMALESILDEDVQSGEVPLSKKLRNYYFRLMRSVGGVHLGRGIRLAEEQAAAEIERAEELELGED